MASPESWERKRLYLTPDGQDCWEKTVATTATTTKIGAWWAVYEMFAHSQPTTPGGVTYRMLYWVIPAASIGATFSTVACMSGTIRGKDDFWNHGLAGVTSAAVIGARYGTNWGLTWALLLGGSAMMVKHLFDDGYSLIPERKPSNYKRWCYYRNRYNDRWYKPTPIEPPKNY